VKAIAQTPDSYLWLGTTSGLVRFDGARFTEIPTLSQDPSRREYITCLCLGNDNELWVGTQSNGIRLLRGTEASEFPMGKSDPTINMIHRASDGVIRYCSPANLFSLQADRQLRPELTDYRFYTGLSEDGEGRLWLSSHDGVLYRENGTWKDLEATVGQTIMSVLADRHGGVWIATWNYLLLWKDKHLTKLDSSVGLLGNHIMSLYEDKEGDVWVGTREGLNRFRQGNPALHNEGDRISLRDVVSILEDCEGSLWVGTDDGLHRFKDARIIPWTTSEGVISNFTASVNAGRDGSIYILSSGEPYGITRLGPGGITRFPEVMDGPSYAARDGSIWVSNTGHLIRIQGDQVRVYGPEDGVPPQWMSFITEDAEGMILGVSNNVGLTRWKPGARSPYRYGDGSVFNVPFHVMSATQASDGSLWLCGYDGLWHLKDGEVTRYTSPEGAESMSAWYAEHRQSRTHFHSHVMEGLADSWLTSLCEAQDGTLWIASHRGGLTRFKDGKCHAFTTRDGLPSNQVYSVQLDTEEHLWMSTPRGLCRVSLQSLEARAAGSGEPLKTELFDTADGMKIEECMHMYQPAGVRAPDGKLWFATKYGAVSIDPRRLVRNGRPPPVFIESVLVDGVSRPMADRQIRLAPGTERTEINFTALSLLVPERVRFMYRMEGFDHDWVDAGDKRTASYTGLDPGSYRFSVIACNNDGVWNHTGASLLVVQQPFFFQTQWFMALSALGIAALVFFIHKLKVRNLERREALLQERVDRRTSELSKANLQLRHEMEERVRAEQEVERVHKQLLTASHQAGMAEVATGILHNVGNVLNSVNISILLSIKMVRESKIVGLSRLGKLLQEHRHDLGDYIANDPKGRHLPAYLEELTASVGSERDKLLGELEQLRTNADHIQEIVTTQQDLASASSVIEVVSVEDIITDAIRMVERAIARHIVTLKYDYKNLGSLTIRVERHKMLQILVNLLQNAKNACSETGRQDRSILISLERNETHVLVSVTDDGVGISPENMTRIFNHGFTTRKNGHGFGLHSASLAAKALGGSLRANSAGPGHGARFTLEIPLHLGEITPAT
jgi:ligand-binding sensor domain-containing protein/signal transduction histidine kinase